MTTEPYRIIFIILDEVFSNKKNNSVNILDALKREIDKIQIKPVDITT